MDLSLIPTTQRTAFKTPLANEENPVSAFSWSSLWGFYLGVPLNFFSPDERCRLEQLCELKLRPVPEPWRTQWMRKHADPILRRLPYRSRLKLTSLLKKIRNPKGRLLLKQPVDWELRAIYLDYLKRNVATPFSWDGKTAAICLSHDVDNQAGYEFVPSMLERQSKLGLKGTFNFVTSYDYRIDPGLIKAIEDNGFEAGLHCLTHDIGLAYRSRKKISSTLHTALSEFPGTPVGYRSAALSISPTLLEEVGRAGLKYDSTIQLSNPKYHCAEWPFPFPVKGTGLWEVPLTLQDDIFLRDASIPLSSAVDEIRNLIDAIVEVGGVFVMILHPHLMRSHEDFYATLIALFGEYRQTMHFATTGEVYRLVSEAYENYLSHLK